MEVVAEELETVLDVNQGADSRRLDDFITTSQRFDFYVVAACVVFY